MSNALRMRLTTKNHGFVLPMVLVVLALLSTLAYTIAMRAQQAGEAGESARQEQAALLAITSAQAQVLFRVITAEAVPGGFYGENNKILRVDGRPYTTNDGAVLSLLDTRGQLNIVSATPAIVSCLLSQMGVPIEQHAALDAKLRDYIDDDDATTIGGGEAPYYASINKIPPRNRALRNAIELGRVDGWEKIVNARSSVGNRFLDIAGIQQRGNLALNAAPRETLICLFGASSASADRFIAGRSVVPFLRKEAAIELMPEAAESLSVAGGFYHGRIMRVSIGYPGYSRRLEYNLHCEPPSTEITQPCRLEYSVWRSDLVRSGVAQPLPDAIDSVVGADTSRNVAKNVAKNAANNVPNNAGNNATTRTLQPFDYPPVPLPNVASAAEAAEAAMPIIQFRF
jgi:type II secretory pathway pseudopilin PulG